MLDRPHLGVDTEDRPSTRPLAHPAIALPSWRDARARILSDWAAGRRVVALVGPPEREATPFLQDLATSLRGAGQSVRVVEPDGEFAIPAGPAILLVDHATRMPDGVLHKLVEHKELFCVLAGSAELADRLQLLSCPPSVVHLPRRTGPPSVAPSTERTSGRRWLWAGGAVIGGAVLAVLALMPLDRSPHRPIQPPPQSVPVDNATVSPSPPTPTKPPLQADQAPAADTAPAPASPPEPLPPEPEPQEPAPVLPTAATAEVSLRYLRGDRSGATLARTLAAQLRARGIVVSDPVASSSRLDHPAIRFYFAEDRVTAEDMQRLLEPLVGSLPIEPAKATPLTYPGQITVAIVSGKSGAAGPLSFYATMRAVRP